MPHSLVLPSTVTLAEQLPLALLPTPFHLLTRLSEQLAGPRIWIKRDDLTGCAASGNKIRKLAYTLAYAKNNGCDTVITCGGLQSNHCRATAILAAQQGLKCILILRGSPPEKLLANTLLGALAGAQIHYHQVKDYQKNCAQLLLQAQEGVADNGGRAHIIPTGASDGIGAWGYIDAAFELMDDFKRNDLSPAAVVFATGSGGTQAGLTLGMHLAKSSIDILGVNVCDDAAYFQAKVRSDCQDWQQRFDKTCSIDVNRLNIQVLDGYVGPGYGLADASVFELIHKLASVEGIVLDPCYTGKAFLALVKEIQKGRFDNRQDVVFLHTGGIFSNFAYIDELNAALA
ncbi:MAG: D-cysteine desulfhydrase family protein [Pseudomonadales bacterium]|nr:D-cysteine desulfhydrase family protein [Pseudomonadales bacterium]